jgi:hypothetical protein
MDFKEAYNSFRREVLYNILIESDISIKLVRLIQMCRNETYSRVCVGKHLSGMFPISNGLKQGDTLSPVVFNFALEHAIRKVRVNLDGMKLIVTHQLSVYADGSVHATKTNTDALLFASKAIGLEVNADKTKYLIMSRDQNAGRNHDI